MSQMHKQNSNQVLLVARVLWFAMLIAPFLFFVILFIQFGGANLIFSFTDYLQPQILLFCVIALMNFGLSIVLPKLIVRTAAKNLPQPKNENEVVQLAFPAFVIRLAFAEAISVLGFVAANLGQKAVLITPFMLLTLVIFVLSFPKYSFFRDLQR